METAPRIAPAETLEKKASGLGSETLRKLNAIIADPTNYIDKGGAGIVYRLPQGLCIKVMQVVRHDMPGANKYDLGNDTHEEAQYLKELSKFEAKGVRSPRYIGHTKKKMPDGMDGIVMEELRATNLEKMFKGDEEMPEGFDWHTFMDALEGYISALHEKGIVHGDMAPRNVMVDKQTGLPRVIDFGRSFKKDTLSPTVWEQKIANEWTELERISEKIEGFLGDSKDLTKTKKYG